MERKYVIACGNGGYGPWLVKRNKHAPRLFVWKKWRLAFYESTLRAAKSLADYLNRREFRLGHRCGTCGCVLVHRGH